MAVSANSRLRVTELSYEKIRSNAQQFLKNQSILQDYRFEGSVMSVLLDLLAYNTHYVAFYQNMRANEAYLDTAILRDSVVSRAKAIGYVPRSVRSARAVVRVTVVPDDDPEFITVEKGTRFETVIDGATYSFSTAETTTIFPDSSGIYRADLPIYEGIWTTERTTITNANGSPVIVPLLNKNADTTSISVEVFDTPSSTDKTIYGQAGDISEVKSTSAVYWVQEGLRGQWELQFGDGILGRPLENNNQVRVTYRISNGSKVNGTSRFTRISSIGGYHNVSHATIESATGGQDKEDIESVRFNAPRNWELQGRVVTVGDVKQFILQNHSDIQAISVWGGDEDTNPQYGRVFITAKPYNGYVLPQYKKDEIFSSLEKYNVQSIEPVFRDATFLFIVPKVSVTFDHLRTSLGPHDIAAKVATAIRNYESSKLGIFDQTFRSHDFNAALFRADAAITNIETSFRLMKRFSPILNSRLIYNLQFHHALFHPRASYQIPVVSSTSFTLPAYGYNMYFDDDGNGKIRICYMNSSGVKVYIDNNSYGTVHYETGTIQFRNFSPSSFAGTDIEVTVVPHESSFRAVRNTIMLISGAEIDVYREKFVDLAYRTSVITEGTSATIGETGTGIFV